MNRVVVWVGAEEEKRKTKWHRLEMVPHLCLEWSEDNFSVPQIMDQGLVEVGDSKRKSVWNRKHLRLPDSQGIQEISVSMKRICLGTLSTCQSFCKASQEKKTSKMTWKLLCCSFRELLPNMRVSMGKVMIWRCKNKRKGAGIISPSKMEADI